MPLQLDRMYRNFGRNYARECGMCSNFRKLRYKGKTLQKCERYGLSHSISTDWVQRWTACGKFNIPLEKTERPLVNWALREPKDDSPLDGQVGIFDTETEI